MLTLFKKSISDQKIDPLYPHEKHTAQMQLCCNSNLLQLKSAATTLGTPKEEKTSIGGTKGKVLKKKMGKYFF
jgi:hypothetical protein